MTYEGRKAQTISFPIGGIGTGSIGLSGNGMLVDWEIQNHPNKCSNNGFSFFAVKAEKNGRVLDARVLNGDFFAPYQGMPHEEGLFGYGFGPDRSTLSGVPHFRRCVFNGSYPFANLEFVDEKFPGSVEMEAFNPMIPSNEDDSGIPAAFFTFRISNTTQEDLDYYIAGSLNSMTAKSWNAGKNLNRYTILRIEPADVQKDSPEYGNLCLSTDSPDTAIQEYWFRGRWFDALGVFWHDFNQSGHIRARSYPREEACVYKNANDVGTITAKIHIRAGETGQCRFLISWNFPNFVNTWHSLPEEEQTDELRNQWKNYYATKFEDAEASSVYALDEWDRLEGETRRFHEALRSTTIPEEALDAIMSTMSVLKTPTCVRLENGAFYGWEGLHSTYGACGGSCTHVWNYAYAMPFLFPRLERSLRETSYRYNQDENGGMRFRTLLPLGRGLFEFRPCADGQFGDILKTYREWKLCGDTEWLKSLWPLVKKSVEYAWSDANYDRWDWNKDGVLEGRQHHTLDMELFGPSGWLNGFYLAALKAASEMAKAMGEDDTAEEYSLIYQKGREWVEKNLFNGEYYGQKINLVDRSMIESYGEEAVESYWNEEAKEIKYQIGGGCSIDQVTGQWHASLIGLGDILNPEQVKSALNSIYRYNFMCMRDHFNPCRLFSINDEWGVEMYSWPDGVQKPLIPIPYAEETMSGFEYQAAASMILNGMTEKGMDIIRAVRSRYDGEKRNPWNEMECGSNYARSMAAYSILLAFSGFQYDMTVGHIGFRPRIHRENFKTFWSLDGAWGTYEQLAERVHFRVEYGKATIRSFLADDRTFVSIVRNEQPLPFHMDGAKAVLAEPMSLEEGDCVEFA